MNVDIHFSDGSNHDPRDDGDPPNVEVIAANIKSNVTNTNRDASASASASEYGNATKTKLGLPFGSANQGPEAEDEDKGKGEGCEEDDKGRRRRTSKRGKGSTYCSRIRTSIGSHKNLFFGISVLLNIFLMGIIAAYVRSNHIVSNAAVDVGHNHTSAHTRHCHAKTAKNNKETTSGPSMNPSTSTTDLPSFKPSFDTSDPSSGPSVNPSTSTSVLPSLKPSFMPSNSRDPSSGPSLTPSTSALPTFKPSFMPSDSRDPSSGPSMTPSTSVLPSFKPSFMPSDSSNPSSGPSLTPSTSVFPSFKPSFMPSDSSDPSSGPSMTPSTSALPSFKPSFMPSDSSDPSSGPSMTPSTSVFPSFKPSFDTSNPSSGPSMNPSLLARYNEIKNVLLSVSSKDALNDPSSPQGKASLWVSTEDTIALPLKPHDARIIKRYVLAVFYYATGGDGWTNNEGWLGGSHECNWYGYSCIFTVELDLSRNQLSGEIPSEIGQLTNLEVLDLSRNDLTGTVPVEIGELSSLDLLQVKFNLLTGATVCQEVIECGYDCVMFRRVVIGDSSYCGHTGPGDFDGQIGVFACCTYAYY